MVVEVVIDDGGARPGQGFVVCRERACSMLSSTMGRRLG